MKQHARLETRLGVSRRRHARTDEVDISRAPLGPVRLKVASPNKRRHASIYEQFIQLRIKSAAAYDIAPQLLPTRLPHIHKKLPFRPVRMMRSQGH